MIAAEIRKFHLLKDIRYEPVLTKTKILIAEVKQTDLLYRNDYSLSFKSIKKEMKIFIIKSMQPSKSKKKVIK